MAEHVLIPNSTAVGGLKSISDENPSYPVGTEVSVVGSKYDVGPATVEYWKNTSGSAAVAGYGYWRGMGDTGDASAWGPTPVALTTAAEGGILGIALAAIPDDYYGWFLKDGYSEAVGVRVIFDWVNSDGTFTTAVGEALIVYDAMVKDDGDWAIKTADADPDQWAIATEAVTAGLSCHVYMQGGQIGSTT